MTQIRFYHLTKTPFEKAVPQLLAKIIEGGHRALLWVPDEDYLAVLDKMLWTSSQKIFLPHGTHKDERKDEQPVYLTVDAADNANGANVFVTVDGMVAPEGDASEMIVDIFDGGDSAAVAKARDRWKHYKSQDGAELTYWQQDDAGKWGDKAA